MSKTNKDIVLEFYEKVFNGWDLSCIDEYMHDDYKQHSPGVNDGKAGFLEFFENFIKKQPHVDVSKIIAEDDLVCVFFKCSFSDGVIAKVFDMYRLSDGKLAEHWDCTMRVDNMETKHSNGQF